MTKKRSMEEPFYYIGFAYILFQVISFANALKGDKAGKEFINKMSADMPEKMSGINPKTLQKNAGHLVDFSLKKMAGVVASLFAFAWILCGCLYAQEKIIFSYIMLLIIITLALPVIQMIFSAVIKGTFNPSVIIQTTNKMITSHVRKIIDSLECLLKMGTVSYILYQHFLII